MADLEEKRNRLLERLRGLGSCAVAFSGGVDSSVLAKAAQLALADRAVAVTASSPSLADGELDLARQVARQIGIRHVVVETNELGSEQYVANQADRCYHCKSELYFTMDGLAERLGVSVLVNGANVEDASDHRPGMRAAKEHQVRSPLAECDLNKSEIRQLAQSWKLPVWNKPATPCLSSRIAYGVEVTVERLRMIDQAEQWLRKRGYGDVRVRYHAGDLARIEVGLDVIDRLCEPPHRDQLVSELNRLGFRFVTIDLNGFRSGSLNSLIPLEQLEKNSQP